MCTLTSLSRGSTQQDKTLRSDVAIYRSETGLRLAFGIEIKTLLKNKICAPEDVFTMLKMEIVPDADDAYSSTGDAEILAAIKNRHRDTLSRFGSKVAVIVQYPGDPQEYTRTLRTTEDLELEFLRFFWKSIFVQVVHNTSLSREHVELALQMRRVRVAISVPTTWGNLTINRYLEMLDEAGFPTNTITLSEPKSAAIFNSIIATNNLRQQSGLATAIPTLLKTTTIWAEIGCATLDLAVTRISEVEPFAKLGRARACERLYVRRAPFK